MEAEKEEKIYISDPEITKGNFSQLIKNWLEAMMPNHNPKLQLIKTNTEILEYKYDNSRFLVTDNDIDRTRINERKSYKDYNHLLKQLLVYYCDMNKIEYKQGMNEMMGIFLLMKYMDEKIELYEVYNIFLLFLDYFFCNYYYEKELYALKSSCCLMQLLLRYHEPVIYNKFNEAFVTPEVYSTNWLLTVFSNKNSFEVCILLYDFLIYYNDQAMIYYLVIAFFLNNKNTILSQDIFHVVQCITKLGIDDIETVKKLMETAIKVKENTPYSLYTLMDILQIFRCKSNFIKIEYEKIKPNDFLVFPIFPSEVLYSSFPSVLTCPNYTCKNFNNEYHKINWPRKNFCQLCKDKSKNFIKKSINYLICDIRIFDDDKEVYICGVFPGMKIFPKSVLISDDFEQEIVKFMKENSSNEPVHVIFVSNRTNNFEKYETKLYSENLTEIEKFTEKYGLSGKKEATLNNELVKNYLKFYKKEENLIKEYDNFRKIVKALMKIGIKYISFSYGGFSEIHYLLSILKLPLASHNLKLCKFCKESKERVNMKKSMISEKTFNTLCSSVYNVVLSCTYNKTRNATIVINPTHIFIFTIEKDNKNKIKFKLSHKMDKTSILAYETDIDGSSTSISFLYSLNSFLSNLVKITLNLLSKPALKRFIQLFST
jgi:hypothetical protein